MTSTRNSRLYFTLLIAMLAGLLGLTLKPLAQQVRFGLEFRGGYEIYYVVDPLQGQAALTQADMVKTADILRRRADNIGMAEPEISIEGQNHIRLKLAGLTSAEESRSALGNPQGLPTRLTEKYTQTVGSVLGRTALKETVTAGLIGIGAIFLLLIGLYRAVGLIAALATVVYLWLLLMMFNSAHATLSLSAVVAFVLGIGIAADASIICFERIREELSTTGDLTEAVKRGFAGSMPTIRDANLVTALAMIALFAAGIGPIQGFSLTMLASILIGIVSNFFLVRQLALWLARSQWLSARAFIGSAKPAHGKRNKPFNFAGVGSTAILLAVLTIVSGSLYYRSHGLNLDIDFTAGTALDIDLPQRIEQSRATQIISDAGTVPATLAVGGAQNTHIAARFDEVLQPADLKKIIGAFQAQYPTVVYEENTADPGVARDFAHRSVYAIVFALLSITLYIGLRFTWRIALATILPIILDVLLVSAIFALGKFEVDVTYIAAILTVIGYSLNDKIVIFSRVNENLRQAGPDSKTPLTELVNRSIGQTLGRSLYTVLTVVMASTSLYFFACEPLQMFSLALLIGLISGACSSLFISSYLWLALQPAEKHSAVPVAMKKSTLMLTTALVLAGAGGWAITAQNSSQTVSLRTDSGLGDLSAYSVIARDSLLLVNQGNLPGARTRMKDLETAWDQAEEHLQPLSPSDWTAVDKAIDRALSQVRSGQPVAADCAAALEGLLAQIASKQASVAGTAGVAPLGDLSVYKNIAVEALAHAQKGDMNSAKERMKDLETAWDAGKAPLQSANPLHWSSIDKSIDRALLALRSSSPDPKVSIEALQGLIAKLESH